MNAETLRAAASKARHESQISHAHIWRVIYVCVDVCGPKAVTFNPS